MARFTLLAAGSIALLGYSFSQDPRPAVEGALESPSPLRTLRHDAFRAGEKLTYVVHYGLVDAGEAVIELKESDQEIQGRRLLRAVGTGRSLGAFNWFYKVDDHYESYIDREGVFPWVFSRRVNEGGYKFTQDYKYLQHKRQVTTQKQQTHAVPAHVQDMISAFYYARTFDFSNARPGDTYVIDCFLDDEVWPLRMKFVGRETIKLRNGKYRCLKFQPIVQQGRIFKTNDDLNVWITDDGNKIPVLAQAKVLVGSIKMELSGHQGLAHPIALVK
ncbi:MAG: DUF3108 domain-containing protein [Flavobacteriales bacterium]|nr:DUF3108 domain-containing protein [Flavobacteriales bacterium]